MKLQCFVNKGFCMKKVNKLFAGLVVLCAASASFAGSDIYTEVGYVPMKITDSDGDSVKPKTLKVTVGKEINPNLAVEADYFRTVSKSNFTSGGTTAEVSVSGYGVYLKPKFEVAKDTELFARVGYGSAKAKLEAGTVQASGNFNQNKSATYGLGIQTAFTKNVYGQADYMVYNKKDGVKVQGFGVSVGYRF